MDMQEPQSQAIDFRFSNVDVIVEKAMEKWHVPGLTLGITKNGAVIYTKAYGWRDVEKKLAMTVDTVMPIGSNSKSFNGVLMALLVDEKKLHWDSKVIDHLPEFRLKDGYATQHMTVRDLLIHNSGLPRHDLVWVSRNMGQQDVVATLPYLEPNTSFRQKFQYQNMMHMTASYLQERVTGLPWSDLLKKRVFEPLGMTHSTATWKDWSRAKQLAQPYRYQEGGLRLIERQNIDAVAGAGAINSTVPDMLKYVQFRLGYPSKNGRSLLSREQSKEIDRSQMPMGHYFEDVETGDYAMGVMRSQYGRHTLFSHGGAVEGFISSMAWVPDAKLGVVVLTNSETSASRVVQNSVLDLALGMDASDWIERESLHEQTLQKAQDVRRIKFMHARIPNTQPSRPLSEFAGRYHHPAYGVVEIHPTEEGLAMRLGRLSAKLAHYHYDVFFIDPKASNFFAQMLIHQAVAFAGNDAGVVDRITIPLEPALAPLVFMRQ
jgi:CubicO group peptidase (beta-lactamase class C family)